MLSKVYVRDPQYNMYLVPQRTSFKRMEMVISNHFPYKDLVHHPIDSQPFISMLGLGVPGPYAPKKITQRLPTNKLHLDVPGPGSVGKKVRISGL